MGVLASAKLRNVMNYIMVAAAGLIVMFGIPFFGSEVGIGFVFPTTTAGWIIFCGIRMVVSGLSLFIFHCFIQQGKLNSEDNDNYKKAVEILVKNDDKEEKIYSPKQFFGRMYGFKGGTLMLSTAFATVALTQAILTFDYVSMLTYIFTFIFSVMFGIVHMRTAEEYWCNTYYKYALKVQKENKEKMEKENVRKEQCSISQPDGTSTEESV